MLLILLSSFHDTKCSDNLIEFGDSEIEWNVVNNIIWTQINLLIMKLRKEDLPLDKVALGRTWRTRSYHSILI